MSTDNGEVNFATENANGTATPVPKIKPTVGRVVYYKARGSADGVFPKVDRAAIVTDVRENTTGTAIQGTKLHEAPTPETPKTYQCRLSVFNPEGLFFTAWLDQGQEGGQWDWMPFQKDQQARLAKEV